MGMAVWPLHVQMQSFLGGGGEGKGGKKNAAEVPSGQADEGSLCEHQCMWDPDSRGPPPKVNSFSQSQSTICVYLCQDRINSDN